jgi:Family of unknown function (DUF6308)
VDSAARPPSVPPVHPDPDLDLADVDAVTRLRAALDEPAGWLLAAYYDPDRRFAGSSYDGLGDNPRDAVSVDDLLAVTMLDVRVKPRTLRLLLGEDAGRTTELLRALPDDVDLWDADETALAAVEAAAVHLAQAKFDGSGRVVASKILARKRPRLVPVLDCVVLHQLGRPTADFGSVRRGLAVWLRDPVVQDRLGLLLGHCPDGVAPLRALDVALWMRGSGSRNAKRVREDAALP